MATSLPPKPAPIVAQPAYPARVPLTAPSVAARLEAAAQPAPVPAPVAGGEKKLTVGPEIFLSGQIRSCDRLVVEGTVEATVTETYALEIGRSGIFKGTADIEDAEIAGLYDGEIAVRGRLFIRATGKLTGRIRYGQIEIEPGGEIAGEVQVMARGAPARPAGGDAAELLNRDYLEADAKLV